MTDFIATVKEHQKEAPVPMVRLANALGIKVYESPHFTDEISGYIKRNNENYDIYVNKHHSDKRKRFTIAHELAHFYLHKNFIGDGLTDDYMYRSGLGSAKETEANNLGAEILMPKDLLVKYNYENKSVSELAEIFNVSEAAMSIRLRNM